MILYGDVLICSLQPQCTTVLQGAFTCEGVQVLLYELPVAEAKSTVAMRFVSGKKSTDCRIPHVTNLSDQLKKEKNHEAKH